MWSRTRVLLLAGLLMIMSGCDEDPGEIGHPDLEGGVLATFQVTGEVFKVWITDLATVQQILDLEAGYGQATIPNGELLPGPGAGSHNDPWSWHLDPEKTHMAETTIEVCDGRPSFVEADLDYWLSTVGRYCPWNAELVDVEDFR